MRKLLAITLLLIPNPTWAHDPYSDWKQPDNDTSCCHEEDCAPARAYKDMEGNWWALDPQTKEYIPIPHNKLLPIDMLKDGRNHLCIRNGNVLCFSGSELKS